MKELDQNIIDRWTKQIVEPDSDIGVEDEKSGDLSELKSELREYKKTWEILNEMQNIEQFDTDKAWNKFFSRIDEDNTTTNRKKKNSIKMNQILAVAATVVILIGVASFYFATQFKGVSHPNNSMLTQMILLPDGTEVYLNSYSEINYNGRFGKKTREVNLKGEAFFNVTKNADKPFIVKTQKSFVKVLGTSFNVNAKSEWVKVVVTSGRVEVYNESVNSEHVVLLPGDYAILNGKDNIDKHVNLNENYLSWLNKKLVFKALPLSVVVNDLINTYHCNIELSDTSIANLKITTTFDNDSIEDVLESIGIALNLSVKKEDGRYILSSN